MPLVSTPVAINAADLADPGERASWYLKSGGYADFPALQD